MMTAIQLPKAVSSLEDSRLSLFPVEVIKKNLAKEFATPLCNATIIQHAECMKVFVRLRPLGSVDDNTTTDKPQNCMEISEEGRVLTLMAPKNSNKYRVSSRGVGESVHRYAFSQVFQPDIGQKEFFDSTSLKTVEDFIGGQNALIFTYGVTSSGKTYTMQGVPGNEGIIPRAIDVIFNSVGEHIVTDSNLHLRFANSVVMLEDEEKVRENEIKNSILALGSRAEMPHDLASQSSLGSSRTISEASSFETETSNASMSINGTITENLRRRSSFMDFVDNIADSSVIDVSSQGSVKFVFFVSFIEIYNEFIYDLLQPIKKKSKRPSLRLAEDKSRPFVKNLLEIQVNSRDEIFKLLSVGKNNLHMAETKLNHNSSRSHCIFTIKMVCIGEGESPIKARVRQLSFCDLAGSERSAKTNSVGVRLNEARKINASLLSLGKCVDALRFNQLHKTGHQRVVPFRESRLTRLFQSILQGEGTASMIVNVSQDPTLFDETIHVLNFSSVASELKVIEKPRYRHRSSVRFGKRSGSFEKFSARASKRVTIEWEPQQTPIKEEQDENDSAEEEFSDDEEYWEDREQELLDQIKTLENSVKELEEKLDLERDNRAKTVKELNENFADMLKKTNDHADERVERMEKFGEEKYVATVKWANETIAKSEARRKDSEERAKLLDEECDELLEKLNALEDRYDEDKPLHDQIEKLEEELKKKDEEMNLEKENIAKMKREQDDTSETNERLKEEYETMRNENERLKNEHEKIISENERVKSENEGLKRSSAEPERESYINNLLEENESGREIIREQINQIESLEKDVEELESKLSTLNENFHREKCRVEEDHQNETTKMEAKLEELEEKFKKENEKLSTENDKIKEEMRSIASSNNEEKKAMILKIEELEKELELKLDEEKARKDKENKIIEEMEKQQKTINDLESKVKKTEEKFQEKKREEEKGSEALAEEKKLYEKLVAEMESKTEEMEKVSNDFERVIEEKKEVCNQLRSCKEELESYKEKETTITSKLQETAQELQEMNKKNEEMSIALEEAITCAEMKTEDALKLKKDLDELTVNHDALKDRLMDVNEKLEKAKEDVEKTTLDREDFVQETEKTIEKMNEQRKDEIDKLKKEHELEITKETKANAKTQEGIKKEHKKQIKKLETELSSANATIEELRKDLDVGAKIEKSMKIEVEELLTKMEKMKTEKTEYDKTSQKQSSKDDVAQLENDVRILTMERDELVKTVQNMKNEFSSIKKENEELKNANPSVSVEKASEIEKMKNALEEMDKLQEKQQQMIADYQAEKMVKLALCDELKEHIEKLQADNKTVCNEVTSLKENLANSEETERKLVEEAESRSGDIKRFVEDLTTQKNKCENLEEQLRDKERERQELQEQVAAKEEEMRKFRDVKNDLASALERRMTTLKTCNDELKKKLEDQIEKNVKLGSENSKLKAELQIGNSNYSMNKSAVETSVNPDKVIKVELTPLKSPFPICSRTPVATPQEDLVKMQDQSTGMIETPTLIQQEEAEVENNEDDKPATRGRSRGTARRKVAKKTLSRRKKAAQVRQATPIPESRSSLEEDPTEVSPAKTRRVLRPKKSVIKAEVGYELSDEDVAPKHDASDDLPTNDLASSSRLTEHEADFPKSELVIDATPVVKKRNRKRTNKQQDEEHQDGSDNFGLDDEEKSLPKRRGKKEAQENAARDEKDSTLKLRSTNIARMGEYVGQAFKKLEAAVSPARSSPVISAPTGSILNDNPIRQSSRRVRKLHAEDISLPLQVSPDDHEKIGAVGRGVGLPTRMEEVGASMKRRLRKRK